jgi:4-cresol dehydrogenase (hydroxylating)
MYRFRERMQKEHDFKLLIHTNEEGIKQGINPFTHGSQIHTDIMKTVALKQALDKHGFDYTAAYAIGWRDLHHIIALLFDKSDKDQEKKADACYRELVSRFGAKGWASYRTGVNSMALVAEQYGEVNRGFNKLLKDAIDPNGVIAPGKSGII